VEGKSGLALKLIASYLDSIEIPNKKDLDTNEFSISFWIKSINDAPFHATPLSHYSINSNSGWFFNSLKVENSSYQSLNFAISNKEGELFNTDTVQVFPNNFTHIVGTFDGSYLSIYKNGLLLDKTRFNGTYISDPKVPLRIGGDAYG